MKNDAPASEGLGSEAEQGQQTTGGGVHCIAYAYLQSAVAREAGVLQLSQGAASLQKGERNEHTCKINIMTTIGNSASDIRQKINLL